MLEREAYALFCNNEWVHASSFCVSAFVLCNVLNRGHITVHVQGVQPNTKYVAPRGIKTLLMNKSSMHSKFYAADKRAARLILQRHDSATALRVVWYQWR